MALEPEGHVYIGELFFSFFVSFFFVCIFSLCLRPAPAQSGFICVFDPLHIFLNIIVLFRLLFTHYYFSFYSLTSVVRGNEHLPGSQMHYTINPRKNTDY